MPTLTAYGDYSYEHIGVIREQLAMSQVPYKQVFMQVLKTTQTFICNTELQSEYPGFSTALILQKLESEIQTIMQLTDSLKQNEKADCFDFINYVQQTVLQYAPEQSNRFFVTPDENQSAVENTSDQQQHFITPKL